MPFSPPRFQRHAEGERGALRVLPRADEGDAWPTETRRIGSWRLVTELGSGAWSKVFLARPTADSSRPAGCYAVKMLADGLAEDELALATLRHEALVGLTVSHPHLVSVLAAHVHAPPHYVVYPYLPGETLAERIDRRRTKAADGAERSPAGPLPPSDALWIARQVASALTALHDAGWLHSDVKPENIVIAPTGHATLIDLGLCRRLGPSGRSAGAVAGSGDYLAPEILAGEPVGPESDLYSLGVVLYEMLAGQFPFSAPERGSRRRDIPAGAACEGGASRRELIPGDIAVLVDRLLARQPLRRPESAREAAEGLMRLEIAHLAERF